MSIEVKLGNSSAFEIRDTINLEDRLYKWLLICLISEKKTLLKLMTSNRNQFQKYSSKIMYF